MILVNGRAVIDIMRSDEMRALLQEKADRIASAAPPGCVADTSVGPRRARASVRTGDFDSILAVSQDPALLISAIDAGR